MNITLVLSVYNKLDLTKEFYKQLRIVYPDAPLVISSGGSTDGTEEWLKSLSDDNLKFTHTNERITFSDTYNAGINMVDTDKLVLVHNDMVIGEQFLENLEMLITEDMLLSYTTIEPPIFAGHQRPGKIIMDFGSSFEDFKYDSFNQFVKQNKNKTELYDGAVFFMSGYKKMFLDIGLFDGFSFSPCFCEDDDFLIRAKLKGYKLKTTECAITYHFVSQTSRFSDEMKNDRLNYEICSNKNFVRKWGIPIQIFNQLQYWTLDKFEYNKFKIKLGLKTSNIDVATNLEPFFDIIDCGSIPEDFIVNEQKNTNYHLKSKFGDVSNSDVIIHEVSPLVNEDIPNLYKLRLILPNYGPGNYQIGNMGIEIRTNFKV